MSPRHEGFTLLELLVAMAIMALIGLLSWQVLSTVVRARERSADHLEQIDHLQRALVLMRQDLEQAVQRPVSDAQGTPLSPLLSIAATAGQGVGLEWTRAGWLNPMQEPRSDLLRVRYEMVGDELHRYSWVYLDQAPGSQPEDLVLLRHVSKLQIHYLDASDQWQTSWPEPAAIQKPPFQQPLPSAIDLRMDTVEFGPIRLLVMLPAGWETGNVP